MRLTPARVVGLVPATLWAIAFLLAPALPVAIAPGEIVANGNFERGFDALGVAHNWTVFSYHTTASWQPESREQFLWDGVHAQHLAVARQDSVEISDGAFAGLVQTLELQKGASHQMTWHGALWAEPEPGSNLSAVRVEWGLAQGETIDWRAVQEWIAVDWPVHAQTDAYAPLSTYSTSFQAHETRSSLFIRLYLAGSNAPARAQLILDGISVRRDAPMPDRSSAAPLAPSVTLTVPTFSVAGKMMPVRVNVDGLAPLTQLRFFANGTEMTRLPLASPATSLQHEIFWRPERAGRYTLRAEAIDTAGAVGTVSLEVTVGEMAEWITSGTFTECLEGMEIAQGWIPFIQHGNARFACTNPPDGGQEILLSIVSEMEPTCAGISQRVVGLRPGAEYRFSFRGRMWRDPPIVDDGANSHSIVQYALWWSPAESRQEEHDWQEIEYLKATASHLRFENTVRAHSSAANISIRICAQGHFAERYGLRLERISLTGYR